MLDYRRAPAAAIRIPLRYAETETGDLVAVAVHPERKQWWRSFAEPRTATAPRPWHEVASSAPSGRQSARRPGPLRRTTPATRAGRWLGDAALVVFDPVAIIGRAPLRRPRPLVPPPDRARGLRRGGGAVPGRSSRSCRTPDAPRARLGRRQQRLPPEQRFTCTLSDLSPQMLSLSRTLNPGCEHVLGDMRTLRLGRTFDAVFVHDAVMYSRRRTTSRPASRRRSPTRAQAAWRSSSPTARARRSRPAPTTAATTAPTAARCDTSSGRPTPIRATRASRSTTRSCSTSRGSAAARPRPPRRRALPRAHVAPPPRAGRLRRPVVPGDPTTRTRAAAVPRPPAGLSAAVQTGRTAARVASTSRAICATRASSLSKTCSSRSRSQSSTTSRLP